MLANTIQIKPLNVANQVSQVSIPQKISAGPLSANFNDYLTMIFESFLGQLFPFQGLLLLNEAGHLMQSNAKARELCQALHQATDKPLGTPAVNPMAIPSQVTSLCEYLKNGRLEFPGQPLQLNEDIFLDTGIRVHLNAEWIELEGQDNPCILVRLEDVTQMADQRALCDAIRYGFTQREREVWTLQMQGLSYREIGEQLFITISTVKKHMKSVHGKRRSY